MRWRFVALLAFAGCAPNAPPAVAPPPRFNFAWVADSTIHAGSLNQTHWGVQVYDPAIDRVLYQYDAQRHFIPASNTKLVVTAVAMGMLGPDYRYRTPFLATGIAGDSAARIVLSGSGDPTWSGRFHKDDFAVTEMLADSIAAKGIRRLGELVVDVSRFGKERVHSSWEIGDLTASYAAPVSAVAIAEAAVRLVVSPGPTVGSIATATLAGPQGVFPIAVNVVTDTAKASASIDVDFYSWPDTIVVSGRVPLNQADTSELAAPDPARYAAATLVAALGKRGVTVGSWRVLDDPVAAAPLRTAPDTRVLMTWTSPPLNEIVAGILKPSQNWMAEQLLKTLGIEKGRGPRWSDGIAVERRYLIDVAKVDSTDFSLRDGSGLTAQNLMSPRGTVKLLEHTRQAPWGELYRAALPQPGMRGGTLSNRLRELDGKVMAKTGSIANVNSLSGFVQTRSGRTVIFSILTNSSGRPSAEVRRAIDALVMALSQERDWE